LLNGFGFGQVCCCGLVKLIFHGAALGFTVGERGLSECPNVRSVRIVEIRTSVNGCQFPRKSGVENLTVVLTR
jgi:hypothetical protein